MTDVMRTICDNLGQLEDDDLTVLSDEAAAECRRRGLYRWKTHAPGYFNRLQKERREKRIRENGRNEALKMYRRKHNMTQEELASVLGTIPARISDWETGANRTPEWVMDYIRRKEQSDGTL